MPLRLFALAVMTSIIGLSIWELLQPARALGVARSNWHFTAYLVMGWLGLVSIVLAILRVDRSSRHAVRVQEAAQRESMKLSQANQELAKAHEELEQRVAQRTAELVEANQRVTQTQAELAQSEKLGMLGQLVAGVAHEINTPTGAVLNVATDLRMHIGKVAEVAMQLGAMDEQTQQWVRQRLPKALSERVRLGETSIRGRKRQLETSLRTAGYPEYRRMAAVITACDLGEMEKDADSLQRLSDLRVLSLLEHLTAMNASSEIAIISAQKIARIVRALRFYAHAGADSVAETDINESIDNTLVILQNRLKHVSRLELDFQGDLSLVRCGPDISQIWTNILNNACDAIEEHVKGRLGLIEIRTMQDGGEIRCRIANEGAPIPETVLQRIFDPFFTTKPVGKGTGLGLSIVQGIVRRCGGSITARNEPGKVVFEVTLPAVVAKEGRPAAIQAGQEAPAA